MGTQDNSLLGKIKYRIKEPEILRGKLEKAGEKNRALKEQLVETKSSLKETKSSLKETKSSLKETKSRLKETKSSLKEAKSSLKEVKERLKAEKGARERRELVNRHNAADPVWHRMLAEQSVCAKAELFRNFAEKTWEAFENAIRDRVCVLIGKEREYAWYYDRYSGTTCIEMDPDAEYWSGMQEVLEEIGFNRIVVMILRKDWDLFATCLRLCGMDMDHVFAYSMMEYAKNENEQMALTWEQVRETAVGKRLVLLTINQYTEGFIRHLGEEFRIDGILSTKKSEIGREYCGYMVEAYDVFTANSPADTVYLLFSVNWNDNINWLRGRGYENIFSVRLLVRGNPESKCSLLWQDALGLWNVEPVNQEERKAELAELFRLLADEDSRKTVEMLLAMRENRRDDMRFITEDERHLDPDYFNRRFLHFGANETYLDIGAEDGGTVTDFINRVGNRFAKICAWEIGEDCLEELHKKFKDDRIEILPYGAWDRETSFGVDGFGSGRHLSTEGEQDTVCKRIDDVVNYPVTLIKMDIEGAELNALKGAEETIKRYKPKLAISLYHKTDDIWELPLYVHSLVPEYKLYIRHHKRAFADTVLYAVP